MAGGEVRAFYEALGIELPGWAHTEAPVRCFADPEAHKREDRDASCSVNVHSGAFNCHGCGARGGACRERAVLQGLLRLRLDRTGHPKVTAVPGTRLGLLPLPVRTREERVLLVEGPSDMLAARSAGLPAIAVPGATAWRSEWASAL